MKIRGLVTVALIGAAINEWYIERRLHKKSNYVTVDGVKIHTLISGQSEPTVILEAGAGDCSITWGLVQPKIAEFCKVFSYDRPGSGLSEKSSQQPDLLYYANNLKKTLDQSNLTGPFILVGHSMGGLIMLRFALAYPEQVLGIVLVDSAHENQMKINGFIRKSHFTFFNIFAFSAVFGIPRIMSKFLKLDDKFPPELLTQYRTIMTTRKSLQSVVRIFKRLVQGFPLFFEQVKPLLRNKPLIVISQGGNDNLLPHTEEFKTEWRELQNDLLNLSDHSQQIIAENSGHVVQWTEPELIVDAVRKIKDQVAEGVRLT